MVYYFLMITLISILSLVFFISKALKDILQHFRLMNSWFRFFLMSRTGAPNFYCPVIMFIYKLFENPNCA